MTWGSVMVDEQSMAGEETTVGKQPSQKSRVFLFLCLFLVVLVTEVTLTYFIFRDASCSKGSAGLLSAALFGSGLVIAILPYVIVRRLQDTYIKSKKSTATEKE